MTIKLDKRDREQALDSLQRYCAANLDETPGRLQCEALLDFLLGEIGPSIYNRAVRDTQQRLLQRVQEVDAEVHEEEFGWWQAQRRR
ncbi:DUF2164 domain-containing protein [Vogesella sp. LIG4]|uniref:DUF2164 domain-containing protein n=1 Tax=Vogesella sp. LIG4 TaxID=1192162 RepID=UPI00081FDF8C|nr:DUF2164 domain-containing protein [Vogesella sp. LIG4]SCK28747.1 Uncharacterized conserved protein, DUF2164 family [Vogesella sp. LIG4]